jgi:hypothetical protein
VVAKCLQSKDTAPISPLEAGLGLGLAFGPLGAIFELLKHMGLQSICERHGRSGSGVLRSGGGGVLRSGGCSCSCKSARHGWRQVICYMTLVLSFRHAP